jgi:L-2-hydroxycarboxylate dehydrogenase (NAD+)
MKISIPELTALIDKVLLTKYRLDEAMRIREVVLAAELSGKTSHGIGRILGGNTSMMSAKVVAPVELVDKSPISALVKGHENPGMLVLSYATDLAIEKAQKSGVAFVGSNGAHTTSGYLSYYLRKIAKAGLIGIAVARSSPFVAGFGSKTAILGTNPIGFAFPGKDQDFIFDMGTSAISYGALLKARINKEPLPEGVALNAEGNPTTNADEAKILMPFDKGYKGAGLAMVVEILAGIFVGAGFSNLKDEDDWGNLLITVKADLFVEKEEFVNNIKALVDSIAARSEGGLPGQKSAANEKVCRERGWVECDDQIIRQLQEFT